MTDKVNTIKNLAIGGFMFLSQYVTPIIENKLGLSIDIKELIKPHEFGVHLISSEIEQYSFELLEFRLKHPNSLNHDLLRLSRNALSLSITKGISKLYKEEVQKKNGKEYEKEIDRQINELDKKAQENFEAKARINNNNESEKLDTAAIKYVDPAITNVDSLNHTKENAIRILVEEISNDLPVICDSLPFNQFFKDNFPNIYQLYFGELLKKPEFSRALIAYQRQVQNMMMTAINRISQERSGLTDEQIEKIGEKINKLSSEDITGAIDEVNKSLQEINNRLDEMQKTIHDYFEDKTLVIEAIRGDELWITSGSKIEIIPNNLETLKNRMKDSLFFKYKTNEIYHIDDNEEAFDYLTKKRKVNHILIPNLLNAMKDICIQWDTNDFIYKGIEEEEEDWIQRNPVLLGNCQEFIRWNLLGIITPYIDLLYAIEKNEDKKLNEQEKRKGYIEECYTTVKTVIDLSVGILLSYLCEEENVNLTLENKTEINKYFRTASKTLISQVGLLHQLMNIFSNSMNGNLPGLLKEYLLLNDSFSRGGKLFALSEELFRLKKMVDLNHDLNQFDNYRAEKILTEFLVHFAFLANYNMISIRGIEYHYIKKCDPKYIQHCSSIGFSKNDAANNKIPDEQARTHAVMLVNRLDGKQCLNLYPFVIDRNALKSDKKSDAYTSTIAFFNYHHPHANYLDYDILSFQPDNANKKYRELHKKEITSETDEYSESNREQYNINCLFESFEKITISLTNN